MDLTISSKRTRASDSKELSPKLLRKLHRTAWNQLDVSKQGIERIIDTQALTIHELEEEVGALKEKIKGHEWASRELANITKANTQWKHQCSELQKQLRADATTTSKREQDLHLKIAESEQRNAALRRTQRVQQNELTEVTAELAAAQAYMHGAAVQEENLEQMRAVSAEPPSQELLSARTYLKSLQTEVDKARDQLVSIESDMRQANERIAQQNIKIHQTKEQNQLLKSQILALENDASETSGVKEELAGARKQIQEMSGFMSQADDRKELQESLRVVQATNQTQKIKLEALAKEQFRLINVDAERDELQAQVATLQHALSDLQSVTGQADVRQVIRGYQTRELQSEQELQLLRSELHQVKQQAALANDELAAEQAKNQELEHAATAATHQAEVCESGQALAQAETESLKDRLQMHMAAASARSEHGQANAQEPSGLVQLTKAVTDVKAMNCSLLSANKKAHDDLHAALKAKHSVECELRQAQSALQTVSAQVKWQSSERVALAVQDLPCENAHIAVGREYLEHQVQILQKENERIRQSMHDLHARLGEVPSKSVTGDDKPALQHAELVIAKQTVEDYRVRLDKMGQFFVQNSESFRKAIQDILGWKVTMRKQVGHASTQGAMELHLSIDQDSTRKLNVSLDDGGKYSITDIPPWLQETDMSDLLDMYSSDGSLPGLLAAVLQAARLDQQVSDA